MQKCARARAAIFRAPFHDLPFDVLPLILAQLSNRKDLHACALVSRLFNRAATPLLYATLDSRILSKSFLYHPSATLLRRPDLAQYVRHVTETGAVHRGLLVRHPNITQDTLSALSLCTNLRSITWIDDSSTTGAILLSFLSVMRDLPIREVTIRTHSDLGETVWKQLITLSGLQKVSIWCMEGPPRVLQGWSEILGTTLTHLELGRCAGVPPTILISVLSQLPLLKDLRLKGAPATAIPNILNFLPDLKSLDTEYLLSGSSYYHRSPHSPSTVADGEQLPLSPTLRSLTVRTSSMDNLGPQKLWGWIRELVPHPGLETFKLHAFTVNIGQTAVPRMFILDLARIHGKTLKNFIVGEAQLTLGDVECLCSMFPKLEQLVCSIASVDMDSITHAISSARHLHTLKLQVQWIPSRDVWRKINFTLQDATNMMLRFEGSKLRVIGVGHVQYTGRWVLEEPEAQVEFLSEECEDEDKENAANDGEGADDEEKPDSNALVKSSKLKFVVSADVAEDKWQT